jgi:hypothetical protein
MVWLIAGLLLLALFGGLVMLTRWARRRPAADETLIADLLGLPEGQAPPAPPEQQDGRPEQQDGQPPPVRATPPAGEGGRLETQLVTGEGDWLETQLVTGEGDWLETQLAGIAEWSDRMQEHIASWAADTHPPPVKAEPGAAAPPDDASRRADHESREPLQPRPAPGRCIATTAKGSQCKLPARPGNRTCAIHTQRADP